MCAITALTVQNTLGRHQHFGVEPAFLGQQIDAVFQDIRPDAVKVGMVSSAGLIRVIAQKLRQHGAQNVVVDPVMVATSGSRLLESDAATALREELFPLATVVTPNIPEAQALSGWEIFAPVDMERAAQRIGDAYGCAVLCKGGHSLNDANDYLYARGRAGGSPAGESRTPTPTAQAAPCPAPSPRTWPRAKTWKTAVATAKEYLSGALAAMLDLGHGTRPPWTTPIH